MEHLSFQLVLFFRRFGTARSECKRGADFSYTGKWSYYPLLLTLAETHELLRTLNRSGNVASAEGAAAAFKDVLPMAGISLRT